MLSCEEAGQGVPIVLLHAFPLSCRMWDHERVALARWGRVITPDLPGFGRSLRQTTPSIPDMAACVATVLDSLSVREPVVLGGLSMGGYVAFEFLRQFPRRVKALLLCSTRAIADTPEQREGRLKTAERIRRDGLESLASAMLPKLLGKTTLESNPAVVDQVQRMVLANAPDGVADSLLAMGDRNDSTVLLPSIACPTLVVAGDEDAFIPPAEAQAMQREIPGARLEIITKAGHLVSLERPAAFEEAVERFFEEAIGLTGGRAR